MHRQSSGLLQEIVDCSSLLMVVLGVLHIYHSFESLTNPMIFR